MRAHLVVRRVPARAPARVLALALVAACAGSAPGAGHGPAPGPAPGPAAQGPAYKATLRWTADGVPHVRAADWAGLGFGQGYAMARLHLCVLADQIVRVRGERARYLGPGPGNAHLDSDFFHRHLAFHERAEAALPTISPTARELYRGFAAGYDAYLQRTPKAQWPAPCRGAAWVRPIDDVDLIAHALAITTITSSRALEPLIARAGPRAAGHAGLPLPSPAPLASNGWAFGAERTAHGGGLVVANPHFPWEGELMFYESQLTIPGQLDVYGAALVGLPLVNIGFNARVAWTHTFSASTRFVVYRLELVPGQPLRYRHGDEIRPILPAEYTVDVRKPDGSLGHETRTLYRTSFGPMLDSAELAWDPAAGSAYALRDVALGDGGALDTYLDLARARDVAGVDAALAHSGTPFVNTLAADAAGDALYVDGSRVPALRGDALLAWQIARKAIPAVELAWKKGVFVVDGSRPLFDLDSDDPRGIVPLADAPRLRRRDVVINANDSYRFTSPTVPLPAASPLYGDDAGQPSPRTLMNLRHVAAGSPDAGADGVFDRAEAAAAMLSNRSYTAEAMRGDVLARCNARRQGGGKVPPDQATPAAVAPLCKILAAWDGRFATTSRGAVLWRELMVELAHGDQLPWRIPYDPAAPSTPSGVGDVDVRGALARAGARLAAAGIRPDAALGDVQRARRNDASVGIPGGSAFDGTADVVSWVDWNGTTLPHQSRGTALSASGLERGGYPVNYGTSFVMAVELGADPPRADVLLTYGNSTDPASPRYRDQLDAFATGHLRPARFTEADITSDPGLVTEELSSP